MCRLAPEQDFKELQLVSRPLFAAAPVHRVKISPDYNSPGTQPSVCHALCFSLVEDGTFLPVSLRVHGVTRGYIKLK